jgi:hypothetical protein
MGDLTSSEVLTDHQQELYFRLQRYCFDAPESTIAFAAKLACEQGWSAAKSERVLGEYRRFLFLAMEAGHPVSPSRAVDLAWHQHLLDTRSYWQEFCPGVMGRPLHHTPSRGARRSGSGWGSLTAARWQATRPSSARPRLRTSGLRLCRLLLRRLRLRRWPPRPGSHDGWRIDGGFCWRR